MRAIRTTQKKTTTKKKQQEQDKKITRQKTPFHFWLGRWHLCPLQPHRVIGREWDPRITPFSAPKFISSQKVWLIRGSSILIRFFWGGVKSKRSHPIITIIINNTLYYTQMVRQSRRKEGMTRKKHQEKVALLSFAPRRWSFWLLQPHEAWDRLSSTRIVSFSDLDPLTTHVLKRMCIRGGHSPRHCIFGVVSKPKGVIFSSSPSLLSGPHSIGTIIIKWESPVAIRTTKPHNKEKELSFFILTEKIAFLAYSPHLLSRTIPE